MSMLRRQDDSGMSASLMLFRGLAPGASSRQLSGDSERDQRDLRTDAPAALHAENSAAPPEAALALKVLLSQ